MLRRATLTLVLALPLAAADLAHKELAETQAWAYHVRSASWVVLSLAVVAGCFLLALVPSTAVAAGAGVLAGGVAGNAVSALVSERGIQNPLVVAVGRDAVAFNVADVLTLAGIALLMVSLTTVTIRNRERLLPPRAFWRLLRRRLTRASGA
jgi:lipoprotein signal peptidase